MKNVITRGFFLLVLATFVPRFVCSGAAMAAPAQGTYLRTQLVDFLESGKQVEGIARGHALYPLGTYPLVATTAYLLLADDPEILKKHYAAISGMVLDRFKEENLTPSGLMKGSAASGSGMAAPLSPGLNGLADIDLYSLHLIAWRIGAYEDALDFLGWSKKLSETITRTFFDPAADAFYPIDADNRFLPTLSPGSLVPVVTDRLLGQKTTRQVIDTFSARCTGLPGTTSQRGELWDDPLIRPVVLDILSNVIDPRSPCFQIMAESVASGVRLPTGDRPAWTDFWRENPSARKDLFPSWRTIATLVNLTLLLGRESLLVPKEIGRLRAGVDSLASALSAKSTSLDSYAGSIAAANGLIAKISHLSELIRANKERWRIIDVPKWLQLSPRTRRLIQEGCSSSIDDLTRAKADLSKKLSASTGIALDVELPRDPVRVGKEIEFTARLSSSRDTLDLSLATIQIGESRFDMAAPRSAVRLTPGGAPLTYRGKLALPPATEPGIVVLHVFADLLSKERRIELHGMEMVSLSTEYDVNFGLPSGRRIGEKPVSIAIDIRLKPDHDIQGTVEGTFLREMGPTPPLPAKFLLKSGSESTKLTIEVSPRTKLAPGRYPFALTVSLDGRTIAAFEDNLVRPFEWLHFGPLAGSERLGESALAYQTDLLKTYTMPDGRVIRWQEVPPGATDREGALWPQRIYGKTENRCFLLYTVVDAPSRMNLLWRLSTKNTVSLWVNSAAVISEKGIPQGDMRGPIELRKGPNSFLFAVSWKETPGRISFELSDENGLPPTALNNDIKSIIDGFERLAQPEQPKQEEGAPPESQLRQVTLTLENTDAAEVSVIGAFNNWEPGITAMRKVGTGKWTVNLLLASGRYPYKFLINRKTKIVDPGCSVTEPDGFGGSNSVLEVR